MSPTAFSVKLRTPDRSLVHHRHPSLLPLCCTNVSNGFLYHSGRGGYWEPLSLAGLPMILLYSANSEGEQIISRTSKLGGCNLKRNLSTATQGFVYIFGSSIVTVSSNVS